MNVFEFSGVGIYLALSSVLSVFCYLFQVLSMSYISVTKCALIVYSNPVFVVFLAYLFLGEAISKNDIIIVISIIAG